MTTASASAVIAADASAASARAASAARASADAAAARAIATASVVRTSADAHAISIRASASASAAAAAALAATAARASTVDAAAHAAATAVRSAADASARAAPAIWQALSADFHEIVVGTRPEFLAARPLWLASNPGIVAEFDRLWDQRKRELQSSDANWRVWTMWWEARRDGLPADEGKEVARLTLSEEMWEEGSETIDGVEAVNAEIARRFDVIDARREPEKHPRPPEQIEGSRLELTPERGLGFASDLSVTDVDDPLVQASLHGRLVRTLPHLRSVVTTPNHTYAALETVLAEYEEVIDVPFDRLDVAEVWGAGAALLGMASAFETLDVDRTLTDPLEPQQLGLLRQAAQLHGAFVLGFPLARRLMDAAERFKLASDTISAIDGPTAEMLRQLSEQHDWVEESARRFITTLGVAYHETGWKVTASGYSAYVIVRNALVVVTRYLSKANNLFATVAGAYAATQIDPGFDVTYQTMRFVLEHARTIMEFAQPFPELRVWFGWVIDHLDEQNRQKK